MGATPIVRLVVAGSRAPSATSQRMRVNDLHVAQRDNKTYDPGRLMWFVACSSVLPGKNKEPTLGVADV